MALSSSRRPMRRAPGSWRPARRISGLIGISLAALPLAHMAFGAGGLPGGGRYVAGAGMIAGEPGALTVTQPGSTRGVIDWNSFSIGKGNTVTFDNGAAQHSIG